MSTYTHRAWLYEVKEGRKVYTQHQEERSFPTLGAGDLFLQAELFSADPYMRVPLPRYAAMDPLHPSGPRVQGASVVAKVKAAGPSTHLKVGDHVVGYVGWQTHGVLKETLVHPIPLKPLSYALGPWGMIGLTAYFALLELGNPQKGETVLVSGAAGAVGSLVVQIAKIKGCRVVGIVGSAHKAQVVTEELGADAALIYKDHGDYPSMVGALQESCPEGVSVYFDNVGGYITDAAFDVLAQGARMVICGQISLYNDPTQKGPRSLTKLIPLLARIQGFNLGPFIERREEMLADMMPWVQEGRIKCKETFVKGFDRLPEALEMLFTGANVGKIIVDGRPDE